MAGAHAATEYDTKAEHLINFAKFVEWPDTAFSAKDSPYVIGVLGEDPFGKILDRHCAGKKWKKRPFAIKRFRRIKELKCCHILFISTSEAGRLSALLDSVRGRPILTVSEIPEFCRRGGMVGFLKEDGKVLFEINRAAARKSNLKLSSQLLKTASKVYTASE